MGWNVSLYMRFNADTDVWSGYLRLLEQLGRRSDLFRIQKVLGFNSSVVSKFKLLEEPFDADALTRVAGLLTSLDKQRLVLQTDISAFRESRSEDSPDIEVEPIKTSLFLRGPQASWSPALEADRLHLIWRVGDFKNYHPGVSPDTWQANWNRLIAEVEVLAGFGNLAEIWAAEEGFDGNPERAFLMYQTAATSRAATDNAMPERLSSREIAGGLLIYSIDGIKGRLNLFN
jgi:hypothetical protein